MAFCRLVKIPAGGACFFIKNSYSAEQQALPLSAAGEGSAGQRRPLPLGLTSQRQITKPPQLKTEEACLFSRQF